MWETDMGMAFTAAAALLVLGLVGLAVALIKPTEGRLISRQPGEYAHRGSMGQVYRRTRCSLFKRPRKKALEWNWMSK